MRSRATLTVAPRRATLPIDWSRSRHAVATKNTGQIGWRIRRVHHSLILTAKNSATYRTMSSIGAKTYGKPHEFLRRYPHPATLW